MNKYFMVTRDCYRHFETLEEAEARALWLSNENEFKYLILRAEGEAEMGVIERVTE